MKKFRQVINVFVFFFIIILASIFFYHEIIRNYNSLSTASFKINRFYLTLAAICTASMLLSAAMGWHVLINSVPVAKKLKVIESVAVVSTSALTKYIPGKIWAYVTQIYLIRNLFISKQNLLVLFILINLISLSLQTALGLFFLIFLAAQGWIKVLLASGCIFFFLTSFFGLDILNKAIRLTNRIFKKEFPIVRIPLRRIMAVQGTYLVAVLLFAFSGYLAALGIGVIPDFREALSILTAGLISSVAGYLAFIMPGGLGVKEVVMFWILNDLSNVSLAIVLPMVSRLLMMLMDLVFGIFGLAFFSIKMRSDV